MGNLDTKTIETLSVNAVKNSIVKCPWLDQYINENDKEPSWDGSIYIYENGIKKKDHIFGRMPVQVKGTEKKDLSADTISFRIDVSDLFNYLNDGGVIFFVVYLSPSGNDSHIYYSSLTPIKLNKILSGLNNQKTKMIKLDSFPEDNERKKETFISTYEACKRQTSYVHLNHNELLSMTDLEKNTNIEELSFSVYNTKSENDIFSSLRNETYLYAKLEGSPGLVPIDTIIKNPTISQNCVAEVTVNGIPYYNEYTYLVSNTEVTLRFGDYFQITQKNIDSEIRVDHQSSNYLRILERDFRFTLAVITNGGFEINGTFINVSPPQNTDDFYSKGVEYIEFYQKMISVLDLFHYSDDIDVRFFEQEKYWNSMKVLVHAFADNQPVKSFSHIPSGKYLFNIGSADFLTIYIQDELDTTSGRLFDFSDETIKLIPRSDDITNHRISKYALLNVDDFVKASNINLEDLVSSYELSTFDWDTILDANNTVMTLLLAFDINNSDILLQGAINLINWVISVSDTTTPFYDSFIINQLQTIKRKTELTEEQKNILFAYIENKETDTSIIAASYLLLDNIDFAKRQFQKLSEEERDDFLNSPLGHFFK